MTNAWNTLFGWPIHSDISTSYTPTLSGGSWLAGLPLTNLQDRRLAKVARSTNAAKTSTQLDVDLKRVCATRLVAIPAHTISAAGMVRLRASHEFDWHALDLSLTPRSGQAPTFARADAATCATYRGADGLLHTALANIPRWQYYDLDGDGAWETPGLLLEGQRTNLVTYSETLSAANWADTVGTVGRTGGQADPAGGVTAYLLEDNDAGVSETCGRAVSAFTGDGTKAISAFVRQGTGTAVKLILRDTTAVVTRHQVLFTWTGGIPVGTTQAGAGFIYPPVQYAGGWWRVAFTADAVVAANTNAVWISPAATNEVGTTYVWGVQAENAVAPSSYIKADAGATVTRAADSLTYADALGTLGADTDDLTFYARLANPVARSYTGALAGHLGLFQLSSANPYVRAYFVNSAGTHDLIGSIGTAAGAYPSAVATVTNAIQIQACAQYEALSSGWGVVLSPTRTADAATFGDITLDLIGDDDAGAQEYFQHNVTLVGDGTKVVTIYAKKGTSSPAGGSAIILQDTVAVVNRLWATITWTAGGVPVVAMTAGALLDSTDEGNGIYRLRFTATAIVAANLHRFHVFPALTAAQTGNVYMGGMTVGDVQLPNFTTPRARADGGGGFAADGAPADGFTALGNSTLTLGWEGASELYGALFEVRIARGLYTLAEMAAEYDTGWLPAWPVGVTADDVLGLNLGFVHVCPADVDARYWRVEISDAANAAGYVDLGRLCVCGGIQPTINVEYGKKVGFESETTRAIADGGAAVYGAKPRRRTAVFTIPNLPESEAMAALWNMIHHLGTDGQFVWVYDPSDTTAYAYKRQFLAVMRELGALEMATYARYTTGFSLVEEL